jgi:hypothetical protein
MCEPTTVLNYSYIGENTRLHSDHLAETLLDLASSCWSLLSLNDLLIDEGNTLRCYAGEIDANFIYLNEVGAVAPSPDACDNYGLCELCLTECGNLGYSEGYCFDDPPDVCDGGRIVDWHDTTTSCHTSGTCYCVESSTVCAKPTERCDSGECASSPLELLGGQYPYCSELCEKYGLSSDGWCMNFKPIDTCESNEWVHWSYLPDGVGLSCSYYIVLSPFGATHTFPRNCYCREEITVTTCDFDDPACDKVTYEEDERGLLPDVEVRSSELSFYPKIVFIKPGPNGAEYVDMKSGAEPISAKYFEVVYSDWRTFRPENALDVILWFNPLNLGKVVRPESNMRPETYFAYLTPETRRQIYAFVGQGCVNNIVDGYTPAQPWENYLPDLSASPSSFVDDVLMVGSSYPYRTRGCGPLRKSMVCCSDKVFICLTDNLEMGYVSSTCGDGICGAEEDSCNCPQDCGPPEGVCDVT